MKIHFSKYHALGNDFLVVDKEDLCISKGRVGALAKAMCHRREGVGADGILYLSPSRKAHRRIDVYNADGSWAEKSGNGLRIAAVHVCRQFKSGTSFQFQIGKGVDLVEIMKFTRSDVMVKAELGEPEFRSCKIPIKTKHAYFVNRPLRAAGAHFRATCLSVGNPHTVIVVRDFRFDWKTAGSRIEKLTMFPRGSNVEFVKVISRGRIRVADWERGAGATGSSGTGAVASVCASVMLGLVERTCEVMFDSGSLLVKWHEDTGKVELTGPVRFVGQGMFEF